MIFIMTLVYSSNYFEASSIATATATVMPTIGLLPASNNPVFSIYSDILSPLIEAGASCSSNPMITVSTSYPRVPHGSYNFF